MPSPETSPTAGSAKVHEAAAQAVPVVSSVTPSSGSTSGGTPVVISGSGLTGATQVRFGATASTSFTVNSDAQISAVSPPGSGTVQVTVSTPGGTSTQFVTYTYVTTPAPTLNSLSPTSGPASGGTAVVLTGSNLGGATQVRFGSTPASSFTVVSATQINAVAPAGSGTVQVTVTTPGGVSNGLSYVYAAAPTVTGLAPTQGPTTGGNIVTVTGSGFTGATAVRFGSTPATSFTVVSDSQISAVAPAASAGPVAVTVTTSSGTSAPSVFYFYLAAPVVTGLSPAQGPVAGGNAVTVTGSGFTGATAVRFGSTPATSFTVVSDSQISAVAPAAPAGPVAVTVTTPGGTSAPGPYYLYVGVPSLTGITPAQGPASGGNTVTLTGARLTLTQAVTFGTAPAAFTVISDTQVTAVAPAGSTLPVPVTVTTPGGISSSVTYTRVPQPHI